MLFDCGQQSASHHDSSVTEKSKTSSHFTCISMNDCIDYRRCVKPDVEEKIINGETLEMKLRKKDGTEKADESHRRSELSIDQTQLSPRLQAVKQTKLPEDS